MLSIPNLHEPIFKTNPNQKQEKMWALNHDTMPVGNSEMATSYFSPKLNYVAFLSVGILHLLLCWCWCCCCGFFVIDVVEGLVQSFVRISSACERDSQWSCNSKFVIVPRSNLKYLRVGVLKHFCPSYDIFFGGAVAQSVERATPGWRSRVRFPLGPLPTGWVGVSIM